MFCPSTRTLNPRFCKTTSAVGSSPLLTFPSRYFRSDVCFTKGLPVIRPVLVSIAPSPSLLGQDTSYQHQDAAQHVLSLITTTRPLHTTAVAPEVIVPEVSLHEPPPVRS